MKRTTTCSPIIGQRFDTMIVASRDKEWLQRPIEILVLETVLSHLKEARKGFSLHVRAQSTLRCTRQLNESN